MEILEGLMAAFDSRSAHQKGRLKAARTSSHAEARVTRADGGAPRGD